MRLVINVTLRDHEGNPCVRRALVDSGAEANVVSQKLVKECGWTEQGPATPLQTVKGQPIFVYGTHEIEVEAHDSDGVARTQRHQFAAVDLDVYPLVLGYPWLYDMNPSIDFRSQGWKYRKTQPGIELFTAKEFATILKKEDALLFMATLVPGSERMMVAALSDGASPGTRLPDAYKDFADVFDEERAATLPAIDGPSHPIDLEPGTSPPWGPLYMLAEKEQDALREHLEGRLERGWIRRSTSPAGAPVLFVPKKDGGLRLCVDYRGLNKITIKNRTPLPLIGETLDRLSRAKIFTKIDLKDAYNRIRIRPGDEWKTAFRTRYGHFEYCVMPMGLCNAPATFQQYINEALAGLLDVFCVVYLDDILIFSDNVAEHADHVRQVLERLRRHQLYVKLSKCEFSTDRVEFLGFVVSTTGVSMEESRVSAIKEWPVPQSFRDVQVFLGFANFYRRFIHRYSHHAAPLTSLLKGAKNGKKTGHFIFPKEASRAFQKLKKAFTEAPILAHFLPGRRIMLETDASVFAIGGILSQLVGEGTEARWHPIAFYSKKMNPTQQAYPTCDQEMLAIITAFEHWRHYLTYASAPVTVKTDHDNLKRFMDKERLNGRQVRWIQKLAEYDFRIEYRPGKSNPADGPSRRPDHKPRTDEVSEELLPDIRAKLRGIFMTRYAVFPPLERRLFAMMALNENSLGGRDPQGGLRCLGRHTVRRIRTGRDALGPVDNRGVAMWLNPTAGTGICRSLVPRTYVRSVMMFETAYNMPSETVVDMIRMLQQEDAFVKEKRWQSLPKNKVDAGKKKRRGANSASPQKGSKTLGVLIPRDTGDPHEKAWRAPQTRTTSMAALRSKPTVSGGAESMETRRGAGVLRNSSVIQVPIEETDQSQGLEAEAANLEREDGEMPSKKDLAWAEDETGLLRYQGKVYVPNDAATRAEILTINHDDLIAGHLGIAKTLELVRRKYFWPGLRRDVKKWIKTCQVCQRATTKRHRPYGKLAPLDRPNKPWSQISMDFITGLPPSAHRGRIYDSVLVIVDRYTKLARYIPCSKTIDAPELAELFMEYWVKDFGTPEGIVSDRGPQFTSKFWASLCFYLKVRRRLSTAFHPQSDGQTEVQNQTLEHYLRVYGTYRQDDWASKLILAEFTYNNSVHSTTGVSPFFAAYGMNPEIRINVEDDIPEGKAVAAHERAKQIQEEREALEERWRSAAEAQKRFYDKKHKNMKFKRGEKVMLSTKHLRLAQPSRKLADRYLGPLEVTRVSSNGMAYELKLPPSFKIHPVFHVSLLEPYYHRAGATLEPPKAELVDGEEEWEVETILADRMKGKEEQFLVRWKGYSAADDTWEPVKHLQNASEKLSLYRAEKSRSITSQKATRTPQRQSRRARRKEK
jgi:hypothetical protein